MTLREQAQTQHRNKTKSSDKQVDKTAVQQKGQLTEGYGSMRKAIKRRLHPNIRIIQKPSKTAKQLGTLQNKEQQKQNGTAESKKQQQQHRYQIGDSPEKTAVQNNNE